MGKKMKHQDFNPTTNMAKNPDSSPNTFVRRSSRLQSITKPTVFNKNPDEIIIVDNENEEHEKPHDDNADDIEQVDVLIKEKQGDDSCERTSANLYKSLYFDSQKKNEALTLENHELRRNMEIALAKLEVYEALAKPTSYGGPISSSGGGDGGGGVAAEKKSPAKKSRHDQTKKRVRFIE